MKARQLDGFNKAHPMLEESNLTHLSPSELLVLHGRINERLRDLGLVRSANNPTGDLAEYLFCKAFDWTQLRNSEAGYDAVTGDGTRIQIKGRRIHRRNKSRQLSAIRRLDADHFDVLAGVLFDDDYVVLRAALIPRSVVLTRSTFVAHTNSSKFMLRDDVWNEPDVQDVTAALRGAMGSDAELRQVGVAKPHERPLVNGR